MLDDFLFLCDVHFQCPARASFRRTTIALCNSIVGPMEKSFATLLSNPPSASAVDGSGDPRSAPVGRISPCRPVFHPAVENGVNHGGGRLSVQQLAAQADQARLRILKSRDAAGAVFASSEHFAARLPLGFHDDAE